MPAKDKTIIMYHRSYRKLAGSLASFWLQFLFCVVPLCAITAFFYPQITAAISKGAKTALAPFFAAETLQVMETPHVLGNYSFLQLPTDFPTALFALNNAVVCILLILVLSQINVARPVMFCINLTALVHLTASLFFYFWPDHFPYETGYYSQLYMVQEISIWFFMPIIIGLATLPLPASFPAKVITMVLTYIYSVLFGMLRYIVFLFLLSKFSLLYMPMFFFVFGPLVDFVYIVAIYSAFVARLANKVKGDYALWKWQY